jgi:hypothetical protein
MGQQLSNEPEQAVCPAGGEEQHRQGQVEVNGPAHHGHMPRREELQHEQHRPCQQEGGSPKAEPALEHEPFPPGSEGRQRRQQRGCPRRKGPGPSRQRQKPQKGQRPSHKGPQHQPVPRGAHAQKAFHQAEQYVVHIEIDYHKHIRVDGHRHTSQACPNIIAHYMRRFCQIIAHKKESRGFSPALSDLV